ncbi:hypothetical protein HYH02_006826 [Chlamydomonas schloesseri]|uniref:Tyrosine specific protein phosphatases domain-containing protein n=1 Tax=Chlamydomonas schloesseri TaxID=2026947 RepID=A0A835WIW1_9CHLO|nr:hypothetical protein HYH02_006826 [Chlamydomonas schloesseri]|eukprot:KAG2448241.1 hypothetical protein HYH02_006826 [Chlamydomonas schloesseri]
MNGGGNTSELSTKASSVPFGAGAAAGASQNTTSQQRRLVDSVSHPLDVSFLPPATSPLTGGRLGLTVCPGKHIIARDGTVYCRDLAADLKRLREVHAVDVVVALLPEAELRHLKVRDYAAAVTAHGMEYLNLPIIEMAAPPDLHQAVALIDAVVERINAGKTVVLHCKGGVGRAGVIAACTLLRLHVCTSARDAIAMVRKYRRGAVESRRQEEFVTTYSRLCSNPAAAWVQQSLEDIAAGNGPSVPVR